MYSQEPADPRSVSTRVVALGEIIWDVFPGSVRLGGAPLNYAVHASRLGYEVVLVSAVGKDELGQRAAREISSLGLNTSMIEVSSHLDTGTASVHLGPGGEPTFAIRRPAAYDDVNLSDGQLAWLAAWAPSSVYFGTLFAFTGQGRTTLLRLLASIPNACRFYDVNLRPGCDSPALVSELLTHADVVKLNETELDAVHRVAGLPENAEAFCRAGADRYGWKAACITLGARGCCMLARGEYVEVGGYPVEVADPVGAGDAFAAALMHGLRCGWPARKIATFANRLGALVASRPGAIPDWSLAETLEI